MNSKKEKKFDSIKSSLAIAAIRLSERADKIKKLSVELNCKSAASISEDLDSMEIALTDDYLMICRLNEKLNNLIED